MAVTTGKTTVSTAGTRVVLGTSTAVNSGVVVKALSANTGLIYVGGTNVASTNGFQLAKSESVTIITPNLANIWIDSAVNSEGVTYLLT